MHTANDILAIPQTDPGKLFPRDSALRKAKYHELVKIWHPDRATGSTAVFAHISALFKAAEDGRWDSAQHVEIIDAKTGKKYNLKFYIKHPFELGELYMGKNIIAWFVQKQHEDLVLNGLRSIGSIRFPDNRMKEQHERFLPFVETTVETDTGYFIIIKKTEDVILLSDLVKHLGRLDPKHTAWVVSSLLNILCFYKIIGLTHNGLTPETVFVSPQHHAAFPLGGWWYSSNVKTKLKWLPPAVHAIVPGDILKKKMADSRIDLASVRAIARFAVGDPTGAHLQNTTDIPKPLANWLRLPPAKDAITDYENWAKVLTDSWGPRRFIKLEVDLNTIYG